MLQRRSWHNKKTEAVLVGYAQAVHGHFQLLLLEKRQPVLSRYVFTSPALPSEIDIAVAVAVAVGVVIAVVAAGVVVVAAAAAAEAAE